MMVAFYFCGICDLLIGLGAMDAVVLSWTVGQCYGMVDCMTVLFIGMNVMKDGLN